MSGTNAYWDVDGVVNAVTNTYTVPVEGFAGWRGWKLIAVEDQPITYSEELVQSLNALAAITNVTSSWLTTWGDRAALKLAPAIGLDAEHWPVIGADHLTEWVHRLGAGRWWKLQSIHEQARLHRSQRLMWVDDEISIHSSAQNWVNRRSVRKNFALSPRQDRGLSKTEFGKIRRFLRAG